ncbi:MAG TPA: cobalt-precorrin-5B (C(1))-methyltransferase CbiD [Methanobacteriaceae archaeon]|nr:cobalt-precorrin-5B (C(1))-methyltransferase CbiD [Methanobacteriaceae archaeon]
MERKLPGQDYSITTGSAATAAAVAALLSLKGPVESVDITTPLGNLSITVKCSQKLGPDSAQAVVVKMPYHDPDVTKNIEISAQITLQSKQGVIITGGDGIGIVTKPGLQVDMGEAAINPVPRKMITSNLKAHLPPDKGVEVTISAPHGKEIAKRTLNSRMGIVGGISILGTTGIARSMSLESYKTSFKCQIDVARAQGYQELVFVPGNIGETLAQKILTYEPDQIIQMGNFVGYMLEEAEKAGAKRIILFGHAGKIIKIAAGIFNTKHAIADGRREVIASHMGLLGVDKSLINSVFNSTTTEEMTSILEENNLSLPVFNQIADSIKERCQERHNMEFEVMILKMNGTILNSNYSIKT